MPSPALYSVRCVCCTKSLLMTAASCLGRSRGRSRDFLSLTMRPCLWGLIRGGAQAGGGILRAATPCRCTSWYLYSPK